MEQPGGVKCCYSRDLPESAHPFSSALTEKACKEKKGKRSLASEGGGTTAARKEQKGEKRQGGISDAAAVLKAKQLCY